MSEYPPLSLVSCRSFPRTILYLEEGEVIVEFKNETDSLVELFKIAFQFETEEGFQPYVASKDVRIAINPKNHSPPQHIPFKVHVTLKGPTNPYRITIDYRVGGSTETESHTFTCTPVGQQYLLVYPRRETGKYYFISHKDPQDTVLGRSLHYHLQKIGFNGFLAEDHKRLGRDLWKKIMSAIDGCEAFIVLWTEDAVIDPKVILDEIEYAKGKGKEIVLLVEKGLPIPNSCSKDIEYMRTAGRIKNEDLVRLVESIEETYTKGGYGGPV